MRHAYETLFRANPMRIEIARFRRRFLGFGSSGLTSALLALVGLIYLGMVLLVANMRGEMPPVGPVEFQTALFCLLGPAMLHGAIAGERERRSWDLLLVAPVSRGQIVAGKFLGALAALAVGSVALALPIAIAAVASGKTELYDLLLGEASSISFGMAVCAGTIFVSARCQRPFMALGLTLGALALWLGVLPLLVAALTRGGHGPVELSLYLNPFTEIGTVMDPQHRSWVNNAPTLSTMFGLPQIAAYLAATVVFLVGAERSLRFADAEKGRSARRA